MGLENREIELNLIDNLYHPFNKKLTVIRSDDVISIRLI